MHATEKVQISRLIRILDNLLVHKSIRNLKLLFLLSCFECAKRGVDCHFCYKISHVVVQIRASEYQEVAFIFFILFCGR